jgi:hypothetical protein
MVFLILALLAIPLAHTQSVERHLRGECSDADQQERRRRRARMGGAYGHCRLESRNRDAEGSDDPRPLCVTTHKQKPSRR